MESVQHHRDIRLVNTIPTATDNTIVEELLVALFYMRSVPWVMRPMGCRTRNGCAGKGQQQFT
jgi:hypothetical protein